MSVDDIKNLVAMFVAGARRAAEAGIDGPELHSGNGYVFTQFISSAINDCDDDKDGGRPDPDAGRPERDLAEVP